MLCEAGAGEGEEATTSLAPTMRSLPRHWPCWTGGAMLLLAIRLLALTCTD